MLFRSYLSRTDLHIIRPMIYIDEQNIKTFIKNSNIPIVENPCPANGFTKREYMKELTYSLEKDIPGLKNNLLNSLSNIEQLNIWHKKTK